MGLDNYACKLVSVDEEDAKLFGDISLCGGMFSGNGNGSFRGKVYASLVMKYLCLDLYQPIITPREIEDALTRFTYRDFLAMDEECSDTKDLLHFFEVCVRENFYITSWF